MAIPQHTIDQILDRTDLVDLIGQRVKLKKTGRTYSGCCPFHQEKSPSFHVYRDKQYYHCFGCQANGNAIRFLMELEQRSFIDVMKDLASRTGIELPKDDFKKNEVKYVRAVPPPPQVDTKAATPKVDSSQSSEQHAENGMFIPQFDPFAEFSTPYSDEYSSDVATAPIVQEGNLYDLLELVAQFYEHQLSLSPVAQQYFKSRGLNEQTLQKWRLGYAPEGWQHLAEAFPYDIDGLKKVGLIRSSDSGRDFALLRERVIFPIRDTKGRVVGFGGRALNDEIKPKYINSPDSEVFHKNQLLYGLYEGREARAAQWLMVEGYMDVIALQQYGLDGAVATLGTASNADHLNTLFKQNSQITIAFDGDAAGQKAARRTLEIALPLLSDGRELRFFVLPPDHDPDSLMRREGLESFKSLLAQAPRLSEFIYAHLTQHYDTSSPEGKSQVMGDLRELTQLLPQHGSYRYLLGQYFKEKLGYGRKWQQKQDHDASLSFNIQNKREDFAVAILVHHPYLFIHFEKLRALVPESEFLAQFLARLDQIFDKLPDDQELAMYYLLGACAPFQAHLLDLVQRTNIDELLASPELADKLASECSLELQAQYLKLRMKSAKNMKEASNLRQQLNDVNKQISLRLVH